MSGIVWILLLVGIAFVGWGWYSKGKVQPKTTEKSVVEPADGGPGEEKGSGPK